MACKYAVNSLDTHFILTKAHELHAMINALVGRTVEFIRDKGEILSEFEDLDGREGELTELLNASRARFLEIENDVNTWMVQKAEPNLVEVERKSSKYKMKWESLRIYDKKNLLRALQKQKEVITK